MKISFPSIFCNCPQNIEDILKGLYNVLLVIKMNQEELQAQLENIQAQLSKASDEIVTKISALEAALAAQGGEVSEGVQTAVDDLKVIAQALDDINPDA